MKGIASTLPTASVASLRSTAADGLALTGCDAGSTVDAMSDAIEGADVMIYGVSLAYKESANVSAFSNVRVSGSLPRCCSSCMSLCSDAVVVACILQCRMEANYAHQQELDMIPLMMQKDYSPKGCLL